VAAVGLRYRLSAVARFILLVKMAVRAVAGRLTMVALARPVALGQQAWATAVELALLVVTVAAAAAALVRLARPARELLGGTAETV
jgi:hypothetical protein